MISKTFYDIVSAMERIFPRNDQPFLLPLYQANSIHDMLVSRDTTVEEITSNLLKFAREDPNRVYIAQRHNLLLRIMHLIEHYLPTLTYDKNYNPILYTLLLGVIVPSVHHNPNDDKNLPKNRLIISDRIGEQLKLTVELPDFFAVYSPEYQAFIKHPTADLKSGFWTSRVILNGYCHSSNIDRYVLVGVDNRHAFEKEEAIARFIKLFQT